MPKSGPLKGWNRPNPVIQVSCLERPLSDRKADIAYEEIIVRHSNRFDCRLSQGQADLLASCIQLELHNVIIEHVMEMTGQRTYLNNSHNGE